MPLNVEKELAALEKLTAGPLQERYAEVFREQPRLRHRQWLIRRILWRLQANAEGDLSERARRRAEELLFLPQAAVGKDAVTEKILRPIAAEVDWGKQREMWWTLSKS